MKKIPVVFDGREPIVSVRLFDATLREVRLARNYGRTRATLAPGAYVARFATSAWRSEQTFLVRPGSRKALTVSPPPDARAIVDSAAPLQGTTTFRAKDAGIVMEASRAMRSTTADGFAHGSLLVVARRRPLRGPGGRCDAAAFSRSPWGDIQLCSADGREAIALRPMDERREKGISCAGIGAAAGPYQLRIATGPRGQFSVQYVFVVPGMQTQIFIVDQSTTKAAKPWASAKVSVHLVNQSVGFDPAARDVRISEELLNLLSAGIRPVFGAGLRKLVATSAYPLATLAFWMLQCDDNGIAPIAGRPSIARLCERLPNVPDTVVLRVAARAATAGARRSTGFRDAELRYPPMLTRAWDLVLGGENRGLLRVPPGSPLATLGVNALGAAPWLRFRAQAESHRASDAGDDVDESSGLGFSGKGFKRFVEALRALVADDVSARVQFNSTHFTLAERRLISLLCPSADTMLLRIMGKKGGRIAKTLPSEARVVTSLSLPRASIMLVAAAAVDKLTRLTILPTDSQLDEFVRAEIVNDAVTFEPLNSLKTHDSGIAHVVEEKDLHLLAVLYLFYHWPERDTDDATTHERIAAMLTRLGFVRVPGDHALRADDITAALDRARALMRSPFTDTKPTGERTIWEDVQIELVSRHDYHRGHLCKVTRRSIGPGAAEPCWQLWESDELAYSASLWPPGNMSGESRAVEFASAGLSRADYLQAVTMSTSGRQLDAGEFE